MENNDNCCLAKILKVIDVLQRQSIPSPCQEGCDKPFLGFEDSCAYNTRPITLYSKTNNLFTVQYYVNNVIKTSSTFRVEEVDGCCAKLRILATDDNGCLSSTNEFVTVNLECFCILKCLEDTFIDL